MNAVRQKFKQATSPCNTRRAVQRFLQHKPQLAAPHAFMLPHTTKRAPCPQRLCRCALAAAHSTLLSRQEERKLSS